MLINSANGSVHIMCVKILKRDEIPNLRMCYLLRKISENGSDVDPCSVREGWRNE